MRRVIRFLLLLTLALPAAGLHAQTEGESALAKLRAQFEAAMAKSAVAPLKQLAADLSALEARARTAEDYETAIACRSTRHKVETELAAAEKVALLLETATAAPVGRVVLKITDAKLEGVRLDAAKGVITGWSGPGSRATWKLPGLPPGGYEVVLRYSSSASEGGTVRVAEAFYTLTVPTRITLKGVEEHNLGTLRIREGSGDLVVSAATVLKSNLMELAGVELLPSGE